MVSNERYFITEVVYVIKCFTKLKIFHLYELIAQNHNCRDKAGFPTLGHISLVVAKTMLHTYTQIYHSISQIVSEPLSYL